MHVAFVSSYVPRRCGLATFTSDLLHAIHDNDPLAECAVAAIDGATKMRYDGEVAWRIAQGDAASYRAVAAEINSSGVDVVNVQHEFGLYGTHRDGAYADHARALLEELRPPVVTTLHTVLPEPPPWMRAAVRGIAERSARVVVMAETAALLLRDVYGIAKPPTVIPHGIPVITAREKVGARRRLGLDERTIIATFGLVDPRKGLEYAIGALPRIVSRVPNVLYIVVGQTHPDVVRDQGERYRQSLAEQVQRLGLSRHVSLRNEYLTQADVVSFLVASDVYVTPYLDPNQITSGTLAYALGAGKAIVSTPYLHAREALADGRGITVPFQDELAIADAVLALLLDPDRRRQLELRAARYSVGATWPVVGRRVLALMRAAIEERTAIAV